MPSNFTENFNLSQWEPGDKVQRTDFNADNAKLDAALAGVAATLTKRGNCQIVTGTYTGNGRYGQTSPNSLTFNKPPVLVLVSEYSTLVMSHGGSHGFVLQNGTSEMIDTSWNSGTVSWYSTRGVSYQMNDYKKVYHYVAFLAL